MKHANHTFRSRQNRRRLVRRGFTLMEIIVVVTIIALLATLVGPNLLSRIGQSKQRIATAETSSLHQQIALWLTDNGLSSVPDGFDLQELVDDKKINPDDVLDPWDNPYVVITGAEAQNFDFDVVSYGADGAPGGEGEDADVNG